MLGTRGASRAAGVLGTRGASTFSAAHRRTQRRVERVSLRRVAIRPHAIRASAGVAALALRPRIDFQRGKSTGPAVGQFVPPKRYDRRSAQPPAVSLGRVSSAEGRIGRRSVMRSALPFPPLKSNKASCLPARNHARRTCRRRIRDARSIENRSSRGARPAHTRRPIRAERFSAGGVPARSRRSTGPVDGAGVGLEGCHSRTP